MNTRVLSPLKKDRSSMINFTHDGMIFSYTKATVASSEDIVGFYVDHAGIMREIKRQSMYGSYILKHSEQ